MKTISGISTSVNGSNKILLFLVILKVLRILQPKRLSNEAIIMPRLERMLNTEQEDLYEGDK